MSPHTGAVGSQEERAVRELKPCTVRPRKSALSAPRASGVGRGPIPTWPCSQSPSSAVAFSRRFVFTSDSRSGDSAGAQPVPIPSDPLLFHDFMVFCVFQSREILAACLFILTLTQGGLFVCY